MLINEKIEIAGHKVLLVPYNEHLVPKYHEWMQSKELLETTASEPLTLEQEFEMQKSWRNDEDKLTFIILDKAKTDSGEISAMIGDTNLFIGELGIAEVMIMIAETSYRRKGYGKEALLLLLRYGIENLSIQQYIAKISLDNTASIKMFEGIGFVISSKSLVFQEVTLIKKVTNEWKHHLSTQSYVVQPR